MAKYTLVHDALLYIDADGNHAEVADAERGKVYDEKDLPAEALARGKETGALVKAGSTSADDGDSAYPGTHADLDAIAEAAGYEWPESKMNVADKQAALAAADIQPTG